jgi:amino acid adenylation domain-containing protein
MQINVIEYFDKNTLKNFPDKIVVKDKERSIDAISLSRKAKKFATEIIKHKNCINRPIAVFLPKSIESVIADLGITYSGNIYMNIDVKYPKARIKNIFDKILPEIIITNSDLFPLLTEICSNKEPIIVIDEYSKDNIADVVDESFLFKRLENIIDTDPYCIINTSGSTGTPKGVALNHKSFIDFTEWAITTLNVSDNEVIGSLSPLYFDIYSFELCLLMAKAATIVIISEQLAVFPARLIEMMEAQKINFIFWVPTIMVNIANLDLLSKFDMSNLRKVLFAGEVFPTKHLNYWRQQIPSATFINLYGPIEITLDCTYYIIDKEIPNEVPIPIGFACRNTDVLILNDAEKQAGQNEKGELCVRGTSLALGYWNDPEKTAKAFVQNPLNNSYPELIYRTGDVVYKNDLGEIVFVGRKDFQVKHLGYRIDLSEIEHIIVNKTNFIDNACVLYHFDKKEICLFYEGINEIPTAEFRKQLLEFLPKYMIPTQFFIYRELPRNPNGKIDRNLLKDILSQN